MPRTPKKRGRGRPPKKEKNITPKWQFRCPVPIKQAVMRAAAGNNETATAWLMMAIERELERQGAIAQRNA